MLKKALALLFVSFFALSQFAIASDSASVRGFGKTKDEAIADAKKRAVNKVCGETILGTSQATTEVEKSTQMSTDGKSSKSLSTNTKTQDENLSIVGGSLRSYRVTASGSEHSLVFVDIIAQGVECKSSETTQTALTNSLLIKELGKVRSELGKLSNSSGLFKNPKNVAQKYHNARVLSQRGEIDLALKAYESLLSERVIFADPIEDMVLLSKRVYGTVAAKSYLTRAFVNLKNRPEYLYALQALSREPIPEVISKLEEVTDTFPPLALLYFETSWNYALTGKIQVTEQSDYFKKLINGHINQWRALSENLDNGSISNFYIDTNRVRKWDDSPVKSIESLSEQVSTSSQTTRSVEAISPTFESCVLDLNSRGVEKEKIKSICTCILTQKSDCLGADLYKSDATNAKPVAPSERPPATPAMDEMNSTQKAVLEGLNSINQGLDSLLSILPGSRGK